MLCMRDEAKRTRLLRSIYARAFLPARYRASLTIGGAGMVASLALVADLALVISSKQAEIGMLGTLGATPAALRQAFVLLGGLVAGSGMLVGTLLGVAGSWVLDRYRLLPVPGVYFLDYVPFLVQPGDLVLVLLLTLVLALASSLYAAQRAAALDPVEAMRR